MIGGITRPGAPVNDPAELRDIYHRDGYVVVPDLVDAATLAGLRRRLDELCDSGKPPAGAAYEQGKASAKVLRKLTDLAAADEAFRTVAGRPDILGVVTALTASQGVLLYSDQAFLKPAFHGSEKPMHQDNAYFKVEPMMAGITCWLAIDDATLDNGCMRYVPGSHRRGLVEHTAIANTPHLVPLDQGQVASRPCPIPAGAAIFHHLLVLHESKANRSPAPRRSWAMHYVGDHAVCPSRRADTMLRVR